MAVLGQPASFSSQPGSPLETLYAADSSNSATVSAAVWSGGQITFSLTMPPPADVVAGSYVAVSGVTPSTFNTTVSAPYLVVSTSGNNVVVASLTNPGTWVSGGTFATSALPNPTSTDGNGNFWFYIVAGIYSVQIYGPTITERDLLDQGVGTVAGGSVLSVALTMPAQFSVAGSPVTTTGTLAVTWANENANLVFAGPSSGGAAVPTFRALVSADLPGGTGTVSSVAHTLTVPSSFLSASVTGSPITTSGTLADTISLTVQAANTVFAGPTSGGSSVPTFRALNYADINAALIATLTTATQPTFRLLDSELTIANTVTSISGSAAAIRGAVTINSGGTLGSGSFVYGAQGKLIIDGTLNSGSGFNAGVFAQLDTSNAGYAHTSGYLAPFIGDYGATSHLSSDTQGDMMVLLNTTTSLINSILKTEAKANYLFDLNDLSQGNYIVAAAVAGSQNACLQIKVNGTVYYIPLNTAHA